MFVRFTTFYYLTILTIYCLQEEKLIVIFQQFERDKSGLSSLDETRAAQPQLNFEDEEPEFRVLLHNRNGDEVHYFEEFWKSVTISRTDTQYNLQTDVQKHYTYIHA